MQPSQAPQWGGGKLRKSRVSRRQSRGGLSGTWHGAKHGLRLLRALWGWRFPSLVRLLDVGGRSPVLPVGPSYHPHPAMPAGGFEQDDAVIVDPLHLILVGLLLIVRGLIGGGRNPRREVTFLCQGRLQEEVADEQTTASCRPDGPNVSRVHGRS